MLWLDYEKLAEMMVFGKKWPHFDENDPLRPKRDFQAKYENVISVALGSPNFVPKIRIFL